MAVLRTLGIAPSPDGASLRASGRPISAMLWLDTALPPVPWVCRGSCLQNRS